MALRLIGVLGLVSDTDSILKLYRLLLVGSLGLFHPKLPTKTSAFAVD